jgi:hypothetical protein
MVYKNALLTCLRKDAEETKIARLQGFSEKDWEDVLTAATRHRVAPILFYTLNPLLPYLNVPDGVRQKMKDIYLSSAARNMRLYRSLLKTIDIFNSNGIHVILLKGAHLAEFVYGNLALRPMSDVDILAKRHDLAKIDKLLIEEGYGSSEEDRGSPLEHLPPYTRKNAVNMEVHFHIASPPFSRRFDAAVLWDRAEKTTFQGVDVLTLGPEDLLLHLSVHTCIHHGFNNGLIPYHDLARAVEFYGEKLDWEQFLKRSREWGVDRCVYLMFALTEKMCGLSIPEPIRKEIRPDREALDALDTAEELVLTRGAAISPSVARVLDRRQGWRGRLKFILSRLFPSRETMHIAGDEPGGRNPLKQYGPYFSRMRVLLKRYGKKTLSAACRGKGTAAALNIQNKRNDLTDWLMKADQ